MSTQSPSTDILILLGSAADESYLKPCVEMLKRLEIDFSIKVASAHRSPDRVLRLLRENHSKVVLAFAGHAAHLAGVVAAHVSCPVIAVPIPSSDLKGLDSLLAIVQMPAGVPVACMALGEAGSANAACFAAQILSLSDPKLLTRLKAYKQSLAEKVESSSSQVEMKWLPA